MFSVSVAALVLSKSQIDTWLGSEWRRLDNDQKSYLQDQLNCCGFSRNVSVAEDKAWGHPLCNTTTLTSPGVSVCMCVRVCVHVFYTLCVCVILCACVSYCVCMRVLYVCVVCMCVYCACVC